MSFEDNEWPVAHGGFNALTLQSASSRMKGSLGSCDTMSNNLSSDPFDALDAEGLAPLGLKLSQTTADAQI